MTLVEDEELFLDSDDEALEIEAELIQRRLAYHKLSAFIERCTPEFKSGWHVDEICACVERIEMEITNGTGYGSRQIVEAPPRHGKSQIISRAAPLWYLGRHPAHEVIVATYNQELADDLGRWAKNALEDPSIKSVFPKLKLRSDSRAANRMQTTKGGGIRYVGVGSGLTGRGGHLIVCDDPIKDAEDADSEAMSRRLWDWYTAVLRTRLAPSGGMVVLHTRWRVNDLIGRLLTASEENKKGDQWRRMTLPAVWDREAEECPFGRKLGDPLDPVRWPVQALEQLRETMPERDWLAMYQQRPMLEEGNIFKVNDFNLYEPGKVPKGMYWYVSTDLSSSTKTSADKSVIWPFGVDDTGKIWWSPDFYHGRQASDENVEVMFRYMKRVDAAGLIIEGGQMWKTMEPFINRYMRDNRQFVQVINPQPTQDKYARSRSAHAMMSTGMMVFPNTRKIREDVIPQFLVFTGKNDDSDDLVDTVAWAGLCLDKLMLPVPGSAPDDPDALLDRDLSTHALTERDDPRDRHAPERLIGRKPRKKGTRYRYA